ncbi:HD family phosphohydrolase [Thermoanaerobacterium thermosulfurigenes]|uniref:HD family phosphohydrolase n=1 Tax=Thermoanaerobacterium thermosulfurigenes TaxID=33950 RepID=UPI003EF7BCA1
MHIKDMPIRKIFLSQKAYLIYITTIYIIVSIFLFYTAITPPKIDIKAGDVAQIDIKAPKDIVDNLATQKKIQEAMNSVNPKYDYDENVAQESYIKLTDFFNKLRSVRKSSGQIDEKLNTLKETLPIKLDDQSLKVLLSAEDNTIIAVESLAISTEKATMSRQITDDALSGALSSVKSIVDSSDLNQDLKPIVYKILSSVISPNMIYNATETEMARKEAASKVEPVVYKKGQNIIVSGEVVTDDQIQVLQALGLLKNNSRVDFAMLSGIIVLLGVSLFIAGYYIIKLNKKVREKYAYIQILYLLGVIYYFIVIALKNINPLLIPSELIALSVSVILDPFIAITLNTFFSIISGMMLNFNQAFFVMSIFGGTIGAIKMANSKQRIDFVKAGIYVSAANTLSILGVGLINSNNILSVLENSLWGIISGAFSVILAIGLLPFWESGFDIITPLKLLELSNPNNPLLKKLMMDAPGTYHHSIIVANLAEAGSDAIGANSLLTRVGAYYHDIGKVKRPYFFKENQFTDENLHDKISPDLSSLVITSHVKDGVELAKKYKLPEDIINLIREHHGTSLVKYFYSKALKTDDLCEEDSFRYPGPKPQTKESAILMLADSIEAAVRSLRDPTDDEIEAMVNKIIDDRLKDGQLNESNLTLKDIKDLSKSFLTSLNGIFHRRIEYPEIENNKAEVLQ